MQAVRRTPRTTLTVAFTLAALAAPALARADANVSDALKSKAAAQPGQTFQVIVTETPSSTVKVKDAQLRSASNDALGTVTKAFQVVDGQAAQMTGSQLLALAAQPGVRSITLDAPVAPDSLAPVPPQVWLQSAGLFGLALPAGGTAPAIAVVDSGVDENRVGDFGTRIRASIDLTGGNDNGEDPNGHGTLVAGIAAGASAAFPGAAPTAPIVSIRVVHPDGSALTSDVIAAADWIYRNRAAYGIRVANFSLHSTSPASAIDDPLDRAVRRLWLTGTVVVAAAGNDGPQRMVFAPASDPFVITVGAVGTNGTADAADDTAAPWSSFGYTGDGFAKPELAAPGRYMVGPVPPKSALAKDFKDRLVAPGYVWMSGTSFAAPVVSGTAAQLLALHPDWTPDQVKGALMATATPLVSSTPMAAGLGEVNAAAAANVAVPPNPNAALERFVAPNDAGVPTFDGPAWRSAAGSDASWVSASWVSASWVSASWVSASWVSASWVSSAFADASWVSASWVSGSGLDASSIDASWVSGSAQP